MCRMLRELRIERLRGVPPRRRRRREGPGGDHLRGRERPLTLREPRRHREPGSPEERVRLIQAVVDDADLQALPGGGEVGPPERRRPDQARAAVEQSAVPQARIDVSDARERREPLNLISPDDYSQAVQDDPVAPPHLGARERDLDPARESALRAVEARKVGRARRRGEVEPRAPSPGCEHATRGDRPGERRSVERRHDLDRAGGARCASRRLRRGREQEWCGERREEEPTPGHPRGWYLGRRRASSRCGRLRTRGGARSSRLDWPSARMWRNW